MDIFLLVLVFIITFIIISIISRKERRKENNNRVEIVTKKILDKGFKMDIIHECIDRTNWKFQYAIYVDKAQNKIVFAEFARCYYRVVDFSRIMECEILSEGQIISTTKRSLGDIAVGGLLGGGIGAAIGAKKQVEISQSYTYQIRIIVDDLEKPLIQFDFPANVLFINQVYALLRNIISNNNINSLSNKEAIL